MKCTFLFGFLLCAVMGYSQQNSTGKYDLANLSVQWEVVENGYKGKTEFVSAFTITSKSGTFPAAGWSLYFNFPRMIKAASVTGGMTIEHINGDFYRLSPAKNFKGLAANQPLRVSFVAGAWAISISDAPAGLYLVWDEAPEKGTLLANYTIKPSTELKQYLRYASDKTTFVTPQKIYEQNKIIADIPTASLTKIFPTPASYKETGGQLTLTSNFTIVADEKDGLQNEISYLKNELTKLVGNVTTGKGTPIFLRKNASASDGYQLTVNSEKIEISSGTNRGIFYGIQSLKTLLPPDAYKGTQTSINIPAVAVVDSARFGHRAFMMDVARNFQPKQQVLKVLDLMSLYKLNVLHFHFNDDEGWRIEIPGLPELTEVGGRRGHTTKDDAFLHPSFGSGPDLSHGSGYYSKADFIEILKYANERHIAVIPEIETPGHARAAIASMTARYNRLMKEGKKAEAEKYLLYHPLDSSKYRSVQRWYRNVMDVALPSTYTFLEKVVDELSAMYKDAGAPLATIHFGGDEVPKGVWAGSPEVHRLMKQSSSVKTIDDLWYYFFGNINTMLKKKGLYLYGWEEIAMRNTKRDGKTYAIPNPDFKNENVQVDVWNNVIGWGAEDLPYRLANAGYKVVLSPVSNMYFDLAYQKAFDEPGYYWGGYVDVDKPFYFIPFDYYKNSTEDVNGNSVTLDYFKNKERLSEAGRQNIPGIQGLLWSETVKSPHQMEYMLLPKLLALAERAWAQSPAWAEEKDSAKAAALYRGSWSKFVNVLGKRELPRLDHYAGGFQYRLPTVGASTVNGKVMVNVQFPGTVIRYTTDGSEPTVDSKLYTAPFPHKGIVRFKTFSSNGRDGRAVEFNMAATPNKGIY
ncbi:MAG TPA: family 20 glycosylhydrolase [Flavisolibacter sp.]|nr:family 20 glycosylhydrolase [Flavisolibacter sp.]